MKQHTEIYSLSNNLTSLNVGLSKHIQVISSHELTNLVYKQQTCVLIFEEKNIDNVLRAYKIDKDKNIRFICIGNSLDSQDRLVLLNHNIEYITSEKISQINLGFFDVVSKTKPNRVLIVEDDINQILITENILTNANMRVKSVTKGEEVMEALEQFKPDLILMDLYLEGVSGDDLVKIIRKKPEFRLLPIVFLTADTTIETRMMVLNAGADDLLTKPINPHLLVSALVNRMERSHQYFAENIDIKSDIIHFNDTEKKEKEVLISFYKKYTKNKSACIVWLKLCDKKHLQKKLGYAGYRDFCASVFSKLPLLKLKEINVCQYLSEDVVVITLIDTDKQKLVEHLNNSKTWLSGNSFSISNQKYKTDFFTVMLTDLSGDKDIESLIHLAENKLIDSGSSKEIVELKENKDDDTIFIKLKKQIENSIKSRNFKWNYHKIISTNDKDQRIYELELVIVTESNQELKSNDYQDVVNKTGMARLLKRFAFEHTIRLTRSNENKKIDMVLLVKQSLVDYQAEESRKRLFDVLKKLDINYGKIVFEFSATDALKHKDILEVVGQQFKRINIFICLSGFEGNNMMWEIANKLKVDWIRLKDIGEGQSELNDSSINKLISTIKKSRVLCYKVLLNRVDNPKFSNKLKSLEVDYIKN